MSKYFPKDPKIGRKRVRTVDNTQPLYVSFTTIQNGGPLKSGHTAVACHGVQYWQAGRPSKKPDLQTRPLLPSRVLDFVSASILCFEIVSTRIASVIFAHDYAFMILSLAILGLGSGGIVSYYGIKTKEDPFKIAFRSSLILGVSLCVSIILTCPPQSDPGSSQEAYLSWVRRRRQWADRDIQQKRLSASCEKPRCCRRRGFQ